MRKVLLAFSIVALIPAIYLILFGTLNPKSTIAEFGVAGWLMQPVAFASLVGMCSVWTYGWDGRQILKVGHARLSTLVFLAYLAVIASVAHPFSSLALWLFYGGWSGLFVFAAVTLPFISMAILLWYGKRYLFGSANNSLKNDAAGPRSLG